VEPGTGGTQQLVNISGEPQMLQVLSLKETAALSKVLAAQGGADVKPEEAPTITGDQ
jgi:hypothetical protein